MSKEKQIEEMAKTICEQKNCDECYNQFDCGYIANARCLYNAGYRKQREARYCADPKYRTLGNCGDCGGDVTCLNKYCPNCGAKLKGGE